MLILEDLYLGDVRPSERSFKRNSQYAKALDEVVRAGDALTDTLTEKQKELSRKSRGRTDGHTHRKAEGIVRVLHDRPAGGQRADRLRDVYLYFPLGG